jgi:adenine-specific DNA-methyltransferase
LAKESVGRFFFSKNLKFVLLNTPMATDPLSKFQSLLRQLFQFDCADLDFGIYRIMNHKRDVLEKWISATLPARVEAELRTGALRADSTTADRLEELKTQLIANFGADALDGDGNLAPTFHGTPLGKQYLELQNSARHAIAGGDQRAIIFNHLYQFFSHYYDSGDFMSLRRYSSRQKYAIPYNGEEVHLHWANADQYYIKTSEYFTDYRWKAPAPMGKGEFSVLFKLRNAEQESGNNKANAKRYFCFPTDDLEFDEASRTLVLPVTYRALTPQEEKEFTGNGDKPQQMLNERALSSVLSHALLRAQPDLKTAITAPARNASGQEMTDPQSKEPVPLLLKHLRTYARRNNSDFFIHKDLDAFLSRELDFYLKNEVLSLDTLLAGGPRPAEGWFQLLHVIKTLGKDIITFLAQLENFQKTLFEKRKFVTDCHWCFTLDRVAADLLPEIAANLAQWAQWEDLHTLSAIEPKTKSWAKGKDPDKAIAWLKTMPYLMVDTSLFKDSDFQDRLLATIPNIDEQMDGLLVHSENFQGLRLIASTFENSVDSIYIDPPYNTGADRATGKFLYKDSFEHSSWLAAMRDRIEAAFNLCSPRTVLFTSLDEAEIHRYSLLLEHLLGDQCLSTLPRRTKSGGGSAANHFAVEHDYVAAWAINKDAAGKIFVPHDEKYLARYKEEDKDGKYFWDTMERSSTATTPYKIEAPDGTMLEGRWFRSEKRFLADKEKGEVRIIKTASGDWSVQFKQRLAPGKKLRSMLDDKHFRSNQTDFEQLGVGYFPNPKPENLIEHLLQGCCDKDGLILDFFGGSGTTAHSVINLNREDSGNRRYILMEMGSYFDLVLKRRIQKACFARAWSKTLPVAQPDLSAPKNPYHGISHAFKVIRLETYEDALANIEFTHEAEGELFTRQVGEEYLLKYALDFETQGSATRLKPEALTSPFDYRLNLFDGTEIRSKPVDLPETFHYLIGLKVESRRWIERKIGKTKTHRYLHLTGTANGDGKRVAVLWRTVPHDWKEADYQAEKEWAEQAGLFKDADRGWYNGPGTFLGAHPLDAEFRRLLFA